MSKFLVGDTVLQISVKSWSTSRYEVTAVDGNRIRLKHKTYDQGWHREAEFELVSRPEPKTYSVRDVAEAIHAVSGVPKPPDYEAKITQINAHLKKVTDPKYKVAQESLVLAVEAHTKATEALIQAQNVLNSFN